MKFSLECEVDSKIWIGKKIKVNQNDRIYIFYPDSAGILEKIKIVSLVKNPEKFYSIIESNPYDEVKHNITINRDEELFRSLIKEFQQLESIIAFNGNLKRIRWNSPKEEILCETKEEEKNVKIFGSNFKKGYPDPIIKIDEKQLIEMISTKDNFSSLTIVKSFWREGNNYFKSFRYIDAFFSFYFILEGLYGKGKTKNKEIEKEFKKSEEFKKSVNWIIGEVKKYPYHLERVNKMLKFRNKNLDVDGIIYLIIKTRGSLHHFTSNENIMQGTPFNHQEFESIAWIVLGISTRAILQKILELNKDADL